MKLAGRGRRRERDDSGEFSHDDRRDQEGLISGSPRTRCISGAVASVAGVRYFGGAAIGKPPAGAITSASLFGANDATRPGFMVLRVKGPSRFHAEGRAPRVNRAFAEVSTPPPTKRSPVGT